MKRLGVHMEEITRWENLQFALWKATKRKRGRVDMIAFKENADGNLIRLQRRILAGNPPVEDYRCFRIRDPKPRKIVAVSFEQRLLHHAVMNLIGPGLEKSQIESSFACLPGRGVHAAARYVQRGLRRAGWFVKIDIEKYFESISHERLKAKLESRFKGKEFLSLMEKVIGSFWEAPGRGLPIGALTSQYFANFYLEKFDRHIQALPGVKNYCRYMDDMIWFCNSREAARESLEQAAAFLADEQLTVKDSWQIRPVRHGVGYCGFRILPFTIRLSRRKKRSFRRHLVAWQQRWLEGEISPLELQRAYDAVHGITAFADCLGFRKSVLATVTPLEV